MNPPALRLYVDNLFTSPYAMSVFVALREKGLAFDTLTLDLDAAQNQSADFAKVSLTQRVPTLVDDEFALSESSAITEYLEETYPATPIYPADAKQRARARQVQAWLRSDLLPIRQERSTPGGVLRAKNAAAVAPGRGGDREVDQCGAGVVGGEPGEPVRRVVDCRCGPGRYAQPPDPQRRQRARRTGGLRAAPVAAAIGAGMGEPEAPCALGFYSHSWATRRSRSSQSAMPNTRVVFKPRK